MTRNQKLIAAVALAVLGLGCGGAPGSPEASDGAGAGEMPEDPPPVKGTLEFEPTAEEPLLELSYEGGLIANPDPTPFIRVYPNGRVLVHYPAYMKKAGDYELMLSDAEVEELLASFADESLLTMGTEALRARTTEVMAATGTPQIPDTHGVETVVDIRAQSFTREGEEEPAMRAVQQRLSAVDLAATAEALPQARRLQDMARGVQRLEALAEREDLAPVSSDDNTGGAS